MEVFLKGSINDIYTRGWWFWNQWTNTFWPFAHIDEDSPHQRWSLPPRRWLTADKWPQPWTCYNRVFKTVGESFGCPQVNHGHLGERGCWNRIDTLFLRSCIKTCVYLTACDKIINLLKKKGISLIMDWSWRFQGIPLLWVSQVELCPTCMNISLPSSEQIPCLFLKITFCFKILCFVEGQTKKWEETALLRCFLS